MVPVVGRRSLESGTMSKPPRPSHPGHFTLPVPPHGEHFLPVAVTPRKQLSHKTFCAPSHVAHSYPLTNGSCTINMRSACASISSVPSFKMFVSSADCKSISGILYKLHKNLYHCSLYTSK